MSVNKITSSPTPNELGTKINQLIDAIAAIMGVSIVKVTEAEYTDLLNAGTLDNNTIYLIEGASENTLAITQTSILNVLGITSEVWTKIKNFATLLTSVDTTNKVITIDGTVKPTAFDTVS